MLAGPTHAEIVKRWWYATFASSMIGIAIERSERYAARDTAEIARDTAEIAWGA